MSLLFLASSARGGAVDEAAETDWRLAAGRYNQGLYDEAAESFRAFLGKHPQNARAGEAQYLLGECLVQKKKYEEARAVFAAIVQAGAQAPKRAEALLRLGETSHLAAHAEEAAGAFEQFLKEFPKHELATAVREKLSAARLDLLYQKLGAGAEKAQAYAQALAGESGPEGEEALYLLAGLHFNAAHYREAAESCEALLKRFPKTKRHDAARLMAANAWIELKDDAKALPHLEAIPAYQRDETLYLRGSVLARRGSDQAAACFAAVVKEFPESRFRPYCLYELGLLEEAHPAWETLLREYPEGALAEAAAYRWAGEQARAGKTEEARALLGRIGQDSAQRASADLLLVQLLAETDLPQALKMLQALGEKVPPPEGLGAVRHALGVAALKQEKAGAASALFGAVLADAACAHLHPDSQYRLGVAREQEKQAEKAEAAYAELLTSWPKDKLVPFALLRRAALQQKRDLDAAADTLATLFREHPDFEHLAEAEALRDDVRYGKAWSLHQAKQVKEAAPLFWELRANARYGAECAYLAGVDFQESGAAAQAEAAFRLLEEKHPQYEFAPEARRLLGETLAAQGKWQEAAQQYAKLIEGLKPGPERAGLELKQGLALYRQNQLPRALELFRAAAAHGEPYVKARSTFFLGEIAFQQQQYAEARDRFLDVSILFRHEELTPAALLEAAKCYEKLGDPEKRKAMLDTLLRDFPKSPLAAPARELLKGS